MELNNNQKKVHFLNYVLLISILLCSKSSFAQFTITDNFRGSKSPDVIIGDDAYFTSGNGDPVGAGWLRLTTDDQDKKGYAYINKTFPSTLGVLIEFEYKMWRTKNGRGGLNQGGDGFSVFLFDGNTSSADFSLGGYGGSLGYTRNMDNTPNVPGLKNGYLGIGFDAFGNFVSKNSPVKFTGSTLEIPNSIVIRGKTTAANDATSNIFLKGINIANSGVTNIALDQNTNPGNAWQNQLDYNYTNGTNSGSYPTARPNNTLYYRRVQIEIIPLAGNLYEIIVRWMKENETSFTELMRYTTADVPPNTLKMGFAASTGWAVNYHEMRNLLVTTPGNLRVVKKADKDLLRSVTGSNPTNQNQITYTIEVTNDTDAALTNVDFKDVVTDGAGNLVSGGTSGDFRITSITHTGFTNVSLPSPSTGTPLATNQITGSFDIGTRATGRIIVVGTLTKIPAGNILNNTVTALPTDIVDQDLDNNTSVVSTPVIAEDVDLMLQKTSIGDNCINYSTGNTFELRVVNTGTLPATYRRRGYNAQRIVVYKDIPSGYVYNDAATDANYWDKLTTTIPGGLRYIYVARGNSTSSQTLNGTGSIMYNDFPIIYTIRPTSTTTTTFNDVATVEYRATVTGSGNANRYDGTNIELTANLPNNTNTQTLNATPSIPTVDSDIVYYCLGQIQALSATATAGNTLNWYTTQNGFKLVNAPIPLTITRGTYKYYVSQSNGSCESSLKEITVIVRNCKMITNPILINKSRSL